MDEPEVMATLQAGIDAAMLRHNGASEEEVRAAVLGRAADLFPGALTESQLDAIVNAGAPRRPG